MCIDDSSKLYVKISIALKGSTVVSMKQSLSSLTSMNEHNFMLNGDSLDNIKIKIQVKKSTYKWFRSELELLLLFKKETLYFFYCFQLLYFQIRICVNFP